MTANVLQRPEEQDKILCHFDHPASQIAHKHCHHPSDVNSVEKVALDALFSCLIKETRLS